MTNAARPAIGKICRIFAPSFYPRLAVHAARLPDCRGILRSSPEETRAHVTAKEYRQMKTPRWMSTVLEEAKKNEGEIKLAWNRQHRPKRASVKPDSVAAAE
ncbi:hypothetical protein N8I71_12350 [Roseibacterium sp. SDUM158016]|jgi:hypothetical protein|uniref:hypothetical protein n=1 Tax=Roseicyclus sediminis TaxID=2980997 RepID=UPI0021D04DB0|nr:hypothetical protein [Roseibacterium sp. SDUM158016]MCU4653626.1 hypothetical protein [Roseibacterium sp. SDUM158016]